MWFICFGNVLFGLSHWIFVMNYFTLAKRLQLKEEFDSHFTKYSIMYYGFGALNVLLPFAKQACLVKKKWMA